MTERLNISSGAKWEEIVGYSRAVRIGNLIEVAGTTAVDENSQTVGVGDPGEQTRYILRKIEKALHAAGATLEDVIRTRVFVTDIARWEEVGVTRLIVAPWRRSREAIDGLRRFAEFLE